MPLFTIPGDEAVATRKSNPVAGWPNRASDNRVEPVARPEFEHPFHLEPGEPIFTIGSCFARNIETELMRRGFAVPMRDLFKSPEFDGLETTIINNYATPSILNEFTWGLEGGFNAEDHIVPVRGGYADLHLNPAIRPVPFDVAVARREAIGKAMAAVADCRVVIMTLGLVEVWHDNQTGHYLNVAPRPSLLKDFPGRFDLHVLSFAEAYDHLSRALALLQKHCRRDLQVILTVSPVPLTSTSRPVDVMIANTYSKSVLRTVAEHVVADFSFVTYFPSYESVVLSDRKFAWKDDLIHVTEQIVAVNVGRMISAFSPGMTEDRIAEVQGASPEQAAALAGAARTTPDAEAFFAALGNLSQVNPDFAIEHARFLDEVRRFDEVLAILKYAGNTQPLAVAELRARALLELGRPAEAAETIEAVIQPKMKARPLWEMLVRAHGEAGDFNKTVMAGAGFRDTYPFAAGRIKLAMFRALRDAHAQAAVAYGIDAAKDEEGVVAAYETAELLIQLGDVDRARNLLDAAQPRSTKDSQRLQRLRDMLPPSAPK